MNCPLCAHNSIQQIEVAAPFFRHLEFATTKKSGTIGQCEHCSILFQITNVNEESEIKKEFESAAYSQSSQTAQKIKFNEKSEPKTRSYLQAELLSSKLSSKRPSILDIGCFDGALLIEFRHRFKEAKLHAFDISRHLSKQTEVEYQIQYWTEELEKIQGQFDLITISHTLTFIKNLPALFKHIERVLKPKGLLFIQVPNITKNPCFLLMSDQYYPMTPQTVQNLCSHFNFNFQELNCSWFSRDIVGIAKKNTLLRRPKLKKENSIHVTLRKIETMKQKIQAIDSSQNISVLGTAINAAFVDTLLPNGVHRFIDENPKQEGHSFRGKEIIHPNSLSAEESVIIPYGEFSSQIQKRIQSSYHGKFSCI
jgi:2-polyprenyl-3-methyl-5-hydroxy-6-metoxy-1,4-benzoquinol methylase